MDRYHLLPQQTLATFRHYILFDREVYLMEETSREGWWSYFPITIALKSPFSLLLGLIPIALTFYHWLKKQTAGNGKHHAASCSLFLI